MIDDGHLMDLNQALRELVRLQLAGEIDADAVWRTRRDMLAAVESSWEVLRTEHAPAAASVETEAIPVHPVPMARLHRQALIIGRWLLRRSWRLTIWSMILLLALGTFFYVGML